MSTIVDIAVGDDRFNILVSALQYVDSEIPGSDLVATLSTPGVDVTVFAPTDAAFAQLAADLGYTGSLTDEAAVTTFIVTNLDAQTIKDVLLYHVSAGAKTLSEVAGLDEVDTLNGATFSPDGITLTDAEPDIINASLVQTDVVADNGIIHVIDRVLLPFDLPGNDAPSIAGIVASSGSFDNNGSDFDLLLASVSAAGLVGALDDPNADLTAFAPNDAAFLGLATALGYSGTSESGAFNYLVESLTLLSGGGDPIPLLTNILLYHVAPESLQASQVLSADSIATLLGADLGVDGASLVDADPDIADPTIIATDIQASNGVVHVIDGVLIPADLLVSNGSNDVDFIIAENTGEAINVGRDNDLVDANGGDDQVTAGTGDDVILGGGGSDVMTGNGGNDLLSGDDGADEIMANNGRDTINGGAGSDTISGNAGSDTIDGGDGQDMLTGEGGADIFIFSTDNGADVITDFGTGHDRIDVSDLGIASFADLQAEASITQSSGDTTISFGLGQNVTLTGVTINELSQSDFIFA